MPSSRTDHHERVYKALLIGNTKFPESPNLSTLRGPEGDVTELARVLTDDEVGLHSADDVTVVLDKDVQDIRMLLARFLDAGRRDDQLLLYYSGHGFLNTTDELYLCARDTRTATIAELMATAISAREISELIAISGASATVIILDCCYSGAYKGRFQVPGYVRGEGRFGLFSGRWSEETPAAKLYESLSPFTACLIKALRLGTLDHNRDRFTDLEDVYAYVFNHLPSSYAAAPTRLQTATVGTVALGRTRGWPPTGDPALPPALIVPDGPPSVVPILDGQFSLAQLLVTNRQYAEFLADPDNAGWRPGGADAARSADQSYLRHWDHTFHVEVANRPVVNVSALAAEAYLRWASRLIGWPLRLPTRTEWEIAARAGRPGSEYVATEIRCGGVNFYETERNLTDVGVFAANPYGIGDLIGNAEDLCADGQAFVVCGGAYHTPKVLLGSQRPIGPLECRDDVGFRCASESRDKE